MNNSPWIEQLKKKRTPNTLSEPISSDIGIIGAGIAGVSTAYFTLRDTPHKVLLIEANKAAHGATGHNAGQVVSYFERQFSELVMDYGLELTARSQKAIESGWALIDQIYAETNLATPMYQFEGYAGCQDLTEVVVHLENILWCQKAGLEFEPLAIVDDSEFLKQIPQKYEGVYSRLPHSEILRLLESNDSRFIAVLKARKGCMNSALFCEDLLEYLTFTYPNRFTLIEESPVHEVCLETNHAILKIRNLEVKVTNVILCTNGFERFTITNRVGKDIDKKFHHLVSGRVGYMAAYVADKAQPPIAISYLNNHQEINDPTKETEPYFYLTRRPYEGDQNKDQTLICIGGPESIMDDTNNYQHEHPYPDEAQSMIDTFLHQTYQHTPSGKIHYKYTWHGLMGYTPSGVRCIGPEPLNKVLLYNLGCNGVGILPSIYGGKKIAQFLNGEELPASIFDPQLSQKEPQLGLLDKLGSWFFGG